MAGKQAQLFQVFVIVIDDLRHKLVKADKAAEIFLEDIQLAFFFLAFFESVFRIGDQHNITGLPGAFKHLFGQHIRLNDRSVALFPAMHHRFADIANSRVGFVFAEERLAELLHFVPQENAAGSQLFRQLKDELRRHVVELPSLCVVRLILGVPSTLFVRISTL